MSQAAKSKNPSVKPELTTPSLEDLVAGTAGGAPSQPLGGRGGGAWNRGGHSSSSEHPSPSYPASKFETPALGEQPQGGKASVAPAPGGKASVAPAGGGSSKRNTRGNNASTVIVRGNGIRGDGGSSGPAKGNRDTTATNENYVESSTKCYLCGEEGHLANLCPKGQANRSNDQVTQVSGGSQIIDVEGDLMTASDSLCHCVSQCLAMGKGIAVLFKQKFGGVDELKNQKVVVPGVATLYRPSEEDSSKYVYYLITKPRYFDKPTYDTLAASLEAMFAHMEAHGVKSVSMPEIGCGLDGLKWPKVHEMLDKLLVGKGITVTVYHFKPAQQMWSKRGKYA